MPEFSSPQPSRRPPRGLRTAGLATTLLLAAVLGGCTSLSLTDAAWPTLPSLPTPDVTLPWTAEKRTASADEFDGPGKELDVPLVGEYTSIGGLHGKPLQGVGLVVNLDGTGEDPPPSGFRTALIEDMRRREVPNPNEVLASPNTALVVVSAVLPPLAKKGDTFDVEVRLPPKSEATSLAGGRLLQTYLFEAAILGGATRKGHELASARGPILLSTGEGDSDGKLAGVLRRGRVVAGGTSTKVDRTLSLFLRDEFKSIRKSRQIADAVGKRFHDFDDRGLKKPLAEAKTDRRVELDLHPAYREDYARFLRVVRAVAFRETDVARRLRMRRLEDRLQEPRSSRLAALELEAIGASAVPTLRRALENDSAEVRFRAATSLTFLDERDGIDELAAAIRDEPAFRPTAFAALTTSEHPEANAALRDLLDETSAEARYGAFRTLTLRGERDPLVRGREMEGGFTLHALDVGGPPLVHLTHRDRAEVVVFGSAQPLRLPLASRAGGDILVSAPPGSDTVTVARFAAGGAGETREVEARLVPLLLACDELGASYPDIAGLLAQLVRQENLVGEVAIDALPERGRRYVRDDDVPEELADLPTASKKEVAADETEDEADAPEETTAFSDATFGSGEGDRLSGGEAGPSGWKLPSWKPSLPSFGGGGTSGGRGGLPEQGEPDAT